MVHEFKYTVERKFIVVELFIGLNISKYDNYNCFCCNERLEKRAATLYYKSPKYGNSNSLICFNCAIKIIKKDKNVKLDLYNISKQETRTLKLLKINNI